MKSLFQLILVCFSIQSLYSQVDQNYFQQDVNYTIHVSLDDQNHILRGNVKIEYQNNSNVTLNQLYFHLWPNAFKNKRTAFAKQQLELNRRDFQFAKEEELGSIDSLKFIVNTTEVNWKLDSEFEDIAILFLKESLAPGEKIQISTTFKVILPSCFSRLCRTEDAYQIAHWYPKPAVFDKNGWQAMPYLSMGEFFSEFADFNVTIDLPADYQLTATGIELSKNENTSLVGRKQIQYKAKQVHDFAWIAGKDFNIELKEFELESGKKIIAEVWHTMEQQELWEKAMEYTEDAIRFYSEHLGEYPYDKITVVQHPLKLGGGQEFPMITFIDEVQDGRELDHVITHEIGHNWFYGILANNERRYAWMDEGLNVYYDTRYTYEKYKDDHFSTHFPFFANDIELSVMHYAYHTQVQRRDDQAPNTDSDQLKPINYLVSSYIKPSLALLYLEKYVGRTAFDKAMKKYFETWKFKHPYPEDFEKLLENELGQDLAWLFDGFLYSNRRMDYTIKKVKSNEKETQFIVENKGEINAPIKWSAFYKNELVASEWIDGFEGSKEIVLEGENYEWITLDAETFSLDVDRTNNHIRPKALLKKYRTTKYGWVGGFDDSRFDKRFLLPLLAFNKYDGLMLGIADYEPIFPGKPVEQEFIPFFGFGSKNFVGIYNLRSKHFFDKGVFRKLEWGVNAKSFSYDKEIDTGEEFRYWSIKPYIELAFKRDALSRNSHSIKYQLVVNGTEDDKISSDLSNQFIIHQLDYSFQKKHALFPTKASIGIEQQSYTIFENSEENEKYLKLWAEFDMSLYWKSNKKTDIRFFTTTYLINSKRESNNFSPPFVRGSTPLSYQGFNDYSFDEFFTGRSEQEGIWSQQVALRDGGFKTALGSAFNSFGQSNKFLSSINIVTDMPVDLPRWLPLKLYFDVGLFSSKSNASDPLKNTIWYSGGIMYDVFDGFFSIYVPLINASEISDLYDSVGASFGRKISFSLNLQKLHPERLKEDMLF